jgi:hypothetical protein
MAVRMDAENSEAFPFIYFLADCKGNEEKLKDIMTKITSALEENGLSKEMVGDVSVYAIGDAAKRQQIAMAVKGSLLAIGNDPESMNKVIGSIESGSDESLGKSERFMAFRERAGGTGHMEIYADLVRTIEFASDMGQPEIATAVAMLGLNAFESLGVSALFGEDDNDHSVQVLVNTKGTSPIFNLFKMPAKPITAPSTGTSIPSTKPSSAWSMPSSRVPWNRSRPCSPDPIPKTRCSISRMT